MDADTFLLNPIDELFQEEGEEDGQEDEEKEEKGHGQEEEQGQGGYGPHSRDSLVYTTDPNMATHKGEDRMPVQGGVLVLKVRIYRYIYVCVVACGCVWLYLRTGCRCRGASLF